MVVFEHEGWKVTCNNGMVSVEPPSVGRTADSFDEGYETHTVDLSRDGLYVYSGYNGGSPYHPDEARPMTIPWPVLEAILEA